MSWTTAGGQTTMLHRRSTPSASTLANAHADPVSSSFNASHRVSSTDQSDGDVVVPMALWNEAPRVHVTCMHVLPLPISQPSQNASLALNRWPSLGSLVQQYDSDDELRKKAPTGTPTTPKSTGKTAVAGSSRLHSARSVANLKRWIKRRKNSAKSMSFGDVHSAGLSHATGNGATGHASPSSSSSATTSPRSEGLLFGFDNDECELVDDRGLDDDDDGYQLCVFAGTDDGVIFYWLLEQDIVVQVNMMIHPTVASQQQHTQTHFQHRTAVQSIVSGIDEWGQSTLISVTKDGAIAQWELPNGVCCRADVTLAKQLAPIKGMEMICNRRFAVVYGEQSRMMVLDTFKMVLLYCVDTAHEQVRRSIAVCELRISARQSEMVTFDSERSLRTLSEADQDSVVTSAFSAFVTPSPQQSAGNATLSPSSTQGGSSANSHGAFGGSVGSRSLNNLSTLQSAWDSLIISLGTEGLVKCFLWSKPRGGAASTSAFSGYQWLQQSCWVISWADDTDDITCSQSTTLRSGDNMNPQTALMRSIKSTYFPRSVVVSDDASLILFIWDTKWAILKRKWLCDISVPTSPSARNKRKIKSKMFVGMCKTSPAELAKQSSSCSGTKTEETNVHWDDGVFTQDNQVMLWNNTGHVFQFTCRSSLRQGEGKLFIFTKDQDQLVPRSFHKALKPIDKYQLMTRMDTCQCCASHQGLQEARRMQAQLAVAFDQQGFTSLVGTSQLGAAAGNAITSNRLVRVCPRGSITCWNIKSLDYRSQSSPSLLRRPSEHSVMCDPISYHTLAEGFVDRHSLSDPNEISSKRKPIVNHLVLGREESRSSCCSRMRSVCRQQRSARTLIPHAVASSAFNGTATAGLTQSQPNALSGTLHSSHSASTISEGSDTFPRYLLDVPIIARGLSDGDVTFTLFGLQSGKTREQDVRAVELKCHTGRVTALAHCYWAAVVGPNDAAASNRIPTSSSLSSLSSHSSGRTYVSAKRASMWKRGAPTEDSCLANDQNPFYRWRFPPPAHRRRSANRNLNVLDEPIEDSTSPSLSSPTERNLTIWPAVHFIIFTGGADGVLNALELVLRSIDGNFTLETHVLQRFKQSTNGIREIVFSPLIRGGSSYPDRFVAALGNNNVVNLYAPVYLHNPHSHGPNRITRGRCGVEWAHAFEFREHPELVCGIEWKVDYGVMNVECDDGMVYVWSLDTGILERAIPVSLLHEGDKNEDEEAEHEEMHSASVESYKLIVGESTLRYFKCNMNKSADVIKKNWRLFFVSLTAGSPSRKYANNDSVSPYAIGSLEFLFFSHLLSWGATPDIDRGCRDLLGLEPPLSLFSCVLIDQASGAVTIPLPWKSIFPTLTGRGKELNPYSRKWQHSAVMSANVALGIVSLSMNLIEHRYTHSDSDTELASISSPRNKEEFHVLWSQLITQHSVVLPDFVPFFREPSLEYLARYGFHHCEYTQLAARALLNGVIKRLPPTDRSLLSAEYSAKLHCESARLETETGGRLNGSSSSNTIDASLVVTRLGSFVLLLSMIGTCFPGEISPAGAREVCDILVYLLRSPAQYVASVAAELMTKGLMLFRPHLVDLSSLIVQLLHIDLREEQRNPAIDNVASARMLTNGGNNAALSLLVELGACESAFVLNLLQQEMNNADRSHAFRECILKYLTELINTHYLLMFRHIPAIVDTIMCCLDPTKPERRKRCLELSTRCLHYLVRRFPMVDFHKDTQRLAVGTMEAVVLIYDLRTATKWRVLDGHTSSISALCFRSDGQILVSYAAREGSVRWWNSGNAGLFGGMLKMQQSCIKEHRLDILKNVANVTTSTGGAAGDLKQVIQTCRFQFLDMKDPTKIKQHGGSASNERRVLRLTREDASQVQFLM